MNAKMEEQAREERRATDAHGGWQPHALNLGWHRRDANELECNPKFLRHNFTQTRRSPQKN
jgi:hypothetical protein